MDRSLEVLGLPSTATASEVKARWKQLASAHHPDNGGDPDTFNEYKTAYEAARIVVNKPIKCPDCKGSGTIRRASGFSSIKLGCPRCKGQGKIKRESL